MPQRHPVLLFLDMHQLAPRFQHGMQRGVNQWREKGHHVHEIAGDNGFP
jgi:hypothetical protein